MTTKKGLEREGHRQSREAVRGHPLVAAVLRNKANAAAVSKTSKAGGSVNSLFGLLPFPVVFVFRADKFPVHHR